MPSLYPVHMNKRKTKTPKIIRSLVFLVIGLSVSCSFPGFSNRFSLKAPRATSIPAVPTATPQPLPPALVESDPPADVLLALDKPITLYFNQSMQRTSVEQALSGETAWIGNISWLDDSTMVLSPRESLAPDSDITLSISTEAKAANGQALTQPISLNFHTAGYLRLAQSLPQPNAVDVDPSSAIIAAFNQPIVALGADPDDLPAAFTVNSEKQTQTAGKGEWLNSSTYIFYPEPAFHGSKRYSVSLNPKLKSVSGSVLESVKGWSFTTASPKLMSVFPENEASLVRLDTPIVLEFNQTMNRQSVQVGFQLLDGSQNKVEGVFSWDETGKVMTYTLASLLDRAQHYTILLDKEIESLGGAALEAGLESHFQTVPGLRVNNSNPKPGGEKPVYDAITLYLSAPIQDGDAIEKLLSITPALPDQSVWYNPDDLSISINGSFQPETSYIASLSAETTDLWGGKIDGEYILNFRTAPISPTINVYPSSETFLTPQDEGLRIMATNLASINLTSGSVTLADFITMAGVNGYEFRQSYSSPDQQTWRQNLEMPRNLSQWISLNVTPDQKPLAPGIYYLRLDAGLPGGADFPYILTVSNIHLTFKISATDVLVWAMDLRTNTPVAGANITIYDDVQNMLASGTTNENGIFQGAIPDLKNLYTTYFAVTGNPGEEYFGIALSNWDVGTSGWDFGIDTSFEPPRLMSYIYTDRPIYRPGQTVNFRAIIRQAYNGRYSLPDLSASQGQLPLTIFDDMGQKISAFNLPVSGFGTAYGEYSLPSDASPGYYRIVCDLATQNDVIFQVANYRKPEINLQVDFTKDQALAGEKLNANISAQYFFGAPAVKTPLHWALYAQNDEFTLPGYQVGVEETIWLQTYYYPHRDIGLGNLLLEGDSQTDAEGNLSLQLPSQKSNITQKLTLEVTITEESGLPVSARGALTLHPAGFYIGIHPDSWIGKAGEQTGFDIQTTSWEKKSSGPHSLKAIFQKVIWVKDEKTTDTGEPVYTEQYTLAASADFITDSQGMARLAFTPPEAGTYQLEVSGEGARSTIYIWVSGSATTLWPELPNQRIHLVADKEAYKPGEIARIFIPNPYESTASALVTVERSIVLKQQCTTIEPGGSTLEFALSEEDAPNIFIAATLLATNSQGKPDYRQGYIELQISPEKQQLDVSIVTQPEQAGPGDEVMFNIQVKDGDGKPLQGEFSLAVVDQAVLALVDSNSKDILSAYYGSQPLGVRTGTGLAVYAQRIAPHLAGMGGGGGSEAVSVTRLNFPDTAFWDPDILTDGEGKAQVKMSLPDNLTTWQVHLRGLTADTRVGEAHTQIVASKPFLLRPAAPRFFVRGDHVRITTVVQNNTPTSLNSEVKILAEGLSLDNPAQASQNITVPSNGRVTVAWWGTVQDVNRISLTFLAQAGEYQDNIRLQNGAIPVLAYAAPKTFSTSGVLDQAVDRLELVSVPRSARNSNQNGELSIELSASLAGVIGSALDVLEYYPYECNEQTVSRFLPNLETYLVFQEMGLDSPELETRLERTLKKGISLLSARQNEDGGWAWWQGNYESDPYITSYVLIGLLRAQEAGFSIDQGILQKGTEYLLATLTAPYMLSDAWQLDRLAFQHYALSLAGAGSLSGVQELYAVRDNLDAWAKAYLALALEKLSPGSSQAETIISDLAATAIRSATGAHWEQTHNGGNNMQSTITTSAIVLYALADAAPKSPLVSEAAHYLTAHRLNNGAWASTFSTAWTIMALNQVMRKTGDLLGDFAFAALINGAPLASGETKEQNWFSPVIGKIPLEDLYISDPNALVIRRSSGLGNLYYRTDLNVFLPAENAAALNQGISLERTYHLSSTKCTRHDCGNIKESKTGEKIIVHLTLTLPNDAFYLILEDYIPAGAEILDTSLKTSQLGSAAESESSTLRETYEKGWGWWYFSNPMIYDDHIAWAVDYLPAGSYEVTYTLVALHLGEFRTLPAHAWEFYFPEIQGTSAGGIFTIKEK